MPAEKIKKFLDEHGVKYVTVHHSPAVTAQEIAAAAHIPGRQVAKTVIVKVDGKTAMAVLPADRVVNFDVLREEVFAGDARLATEEEFEQLFPECEVGAMPPFGNLYGMDVYVDQSLAEDQHIAFNAGNHRELIQMSYADYQRLVQPTVCAFATGRD